MAEVGSNQFTPNGQKFFNEGRCLLDVTVELPPHGNCSKPTVGKLIVPIIGGATSNMAGYECASCHQTVFQPARGTCF